MDLLAHRIRHCRQLLGMTQDELAGDDFSKSFISQVEKGQVLPSVENLILIAQRLGQCPGYFLVEECRLDRPALALKVVAREISAAASRIEDSIEKISDREEPSG